MFTRSAASVFAVAWLCVTATTAALAAPAGAQWQGVATSAGSTVEIDKNRISRLKNGKTSAWTRLSLDHPLLDFENQVRYTAVQALNHYDCAQGSFSTQQRTYWLDGRAVKTEKVKGPHLAVQPDSLDARLLQEACKPRTVGEMQQTATRAAAAVAERPRAMHAEMVSAGDLAPARSTKVADAPAPVAETGGAKPRMFDMPLIDKSKAVDPYAGATAPAAPAATTAPAPAAAKPPAAAYPAAVVSTKAPPPVQELSRQERELMLATSGPRKATPKKKTEPPPPPPPDYSHVHWGYAGLGAPENWSKIKPGYSLCGTGKRQSPIDIRGGIKVDLESIKFDYKLTEFRIIDNGHTVQVEVGEGSTITVMGQSYQLVQFHFHRPSEERINGKTYDMVAHLVHKDYDNRLAVIAVLMEKGMEHPIIQTLWNYMPLEVGMESQPPDVLIDLNRLLPEKRDYYTYMGSLTTPPCTENVLWMVFKTPVPVSPEQIGIFSRLYPNNARPVQPTHDRLIKGTR
ncbi:MAG: carbonic anhydrase family protein [Rhodocyclaceae bacterium]|nr:carbonic anhydrase family protein [Rhodocyclaceae bacterium]MDZ4215923.1 carbonic anhydrase family protein [Rhodocyclaceae bacterium]